MRYLTTAFGMELRRCLLHRRLWIFLLLLTGAAALFRLLPWQGEGGIVTVGVAAPQGEGTAFLAGLERHGGELVRFRPADEDEILQCVSTSRWDCGLILREDFDQRLARGEYEGLITLVTGPGSTVYPLVRETVAAVVLELATPGIAREYVEQRLQVSGEQLEQAIPRLEEILPEDQRVAVVPETADGQAMEPLALAEAGMEQAVQGLLAVGLLIWSLSVGADLGRWKESGQAKRLLGVRSLWQVLLPRLTAWMVPALLASSAALLLATGSWMGAVMLLPYLLALGGLSLLLSRGQVWRVLPVLLPFAAAAGLLLSPVLVDLTQMAPGLSRLSGFMPVTLYLDGCAGQILAVWKLVGMAALLGGLGGVSLPASDKPGPRQSRACR